MSMLVGTFNHSVDIKGRVNIPSRFRELLGDEVVITAGIGDSLMLYSLDGWDKFMARFSGAISEMEDIRYFFLGNAHSDTLDKQGRVTIPLKLRQEAFIEKEVSIIGMQDRVEIWSTAVWESKRQAFDKKSILDKMKAAGV